MLPEAKRSIYIVQNIEVHIEKHAYIIEQESIGRLSSEGTYTVSIVISTANKLEWQKVDGNHGLQVINLYMNVCPSTGAFLTYEIINKQIRT